MIDKNIAPSLTCTHDGSPAVCCRQNCTDKVVSFDRATYNQGKHAQYDMGIADDGIAQTVIAKGAGGVAYAIPAHANTQSSER